MNGGVPTDTAFDVFKQLFEQASTEEGPSDASLRMLLQGLEPETRLIVERLSLPHWFDDSIASVVAPNVGLDRTKELLGTVLSLPFVRVHPRGYTYHDVVRSELRQYLTRAKIDEYQNVSRKLAGAFARQYDETNDPQTLREHVYHTLASDESVGLSDFETLFNAARQQRQLAICETLTRMSEEQKPILSDGGQALIGYYAGLSAFDQHRLPEAEALLGAVQDHFLPTIQARSVQFYRGRISEAKGDTGVAEAAYIQELSELDSSENTLEVSAELRQRLAEICLLRGDLEIAERYVRQALEANQLLRNIVGQATNLDTLGRIYADLLDFEGARESFNTALAVIEGAGSSYHGAKVYCDLASVNLAFARFDEGNDYYKRALRIREQMEDKYGIALTHWSLGLLQLQWSGGDKADKEIQHLEAAVDHMKASLAIFKELNDNLNSARVSASLAELYEHLDMGGVALACLNDELKEAPEGSAQRRYLANQIEIMENELHSAGIRQNLSRLGIIVIRIVGVVLFLVALVVLLKCIVFGY